MRGIPRRNLERNFEGDTSNVLDEKNINIFF
jgi:hypothetical protein